MVDPEIELKPLSKKHSAFVDEYLRLFNGTRAYLRVYPHVKEHTARVNASKLLADTSISDAIKQRMDELHMSADEALQLLADQGRANIGDFFKAGEEWVRWPLPTQEILGEKEIEETDVDGKVIKTYPMYWVRRVYLDLDKLLDPKYAHLVDEFSDSPKNGLSIKLPHKADIADKILRVHGKYKDNIDITTGGEKIIINVGIDPDKV